MVLLRAISLLCFSFFSSFFFNTNYSAIDFAMAGESKSVANLLVKLRGGIFPSAKKRILTSALRELLFDLLFVVFELLLDKSLLELVRACWSLLLVDMFLFPSSLLVSLLVSLLAPTTLSHTLSHTLHTSLTHFSRSHGLWRASHHHCQV